MIQVKSAQLPEGTVIEFQTVFGVKWLYEKKNGGWISGSDYLSDNEMKGLEDVGVEVKVKSWPKPIVIDEDTSDGYHTFKELYDMRLLLTAGLFNEWGENTGEIWNKRQAPLVFKSKLHSDGTIPFNDPNWFIVVAETKEGQISFHYEVKDWDLFYAVPEVTLPPKYDGHTAADVAVRLRKLLS